MGSDGAEFVARGVDTKDILESRKRRRSARFGDFLPIW